MSVVLFPLPPVFRQFLCFGKTILNASALSCMLADLPQSSANSITVLHALSHGALMIPWPTLDVSDRVDHLTQPTPLASAPWRKLSCSEAKAHLLLTLNNFHFYPLIGETWSGFHICSSLICVCHHSSAWHLSCHLVCSYSVFLVTEAKPSDLRLSCLFEPPLCSEALCLHLVSAVWPWSCLPNSQPELASVSGRNAYGELHWAQPVWKCLIYLDDPLR